MRLFSIAIIYMASGFVALFAKDPVSGIVLRLKEYDVVRVYREYGDNRLVILHYCGKGYELPDDEITIIDWTNAKNGKYYIAAKAVNTDKGLPGAEWVVSVTSVKEEIDLQRYLGVRCEFSEFVVYFAEAIRRIDAGNDRCGKVPEKRSSHSAP